MKRRQFFSFKYSVFFFCSYWGIFSVFVGSILVPFPKFNFLSFIWQFNSLRADEVFLDSIYSFSSLYVSPDPNPSLLLQFSLARHRVNCDWDEQQEQVPSLSYCACAVQGFTLMEKRVYQVWKGSNVRLHCFHSFGCFWGIILKLAESCLNSL